MSENSSPHVDNSKPEDSFLRNVRLIIGSQFADYYAHLFDLGLIYLDSSGRIVEAGAPGTEEEV